MKFTEKSVTTQLEILKRKLGGELFEDCLLYTSLMFILYYLLFKYD